MKNSQNIPEEANFKAIYRRIHLSFQIGRCMFCTSLAKSFLTASFL